MAAAEVRNARVQPDGAGAFEVRLRFRYADFKERDDCKALSYRWDPAPKEWYKAGFSCPDATDEATRWQQRFDGLDQTPSRWVVPKRRRTVQSPSTPAPSADVSGNIRALQADNERLQDLQSMHTRRIAELEEEVRALKRLAESAKSAGTFHAVCPSCGSDVFFTVKEVEKV